ncbi:E3 ubiquitin-protein ligase MIB2-like isoform X2 [Babylonia areolata]
MAAAGLRVIRGPGWSHGDSDGGEGHVGTVTQVKDDGAIEVTWDGGQVTEVKAEAKELRVLDSATVGVRNVDYSCDECQESGICGMRWRCCLCDDYDLCSICYFADRHDCSHPFDRFETPTAAPERVQKRSTSTKIRVMGVYPDATVTRGRHWEWEDQDGGIGTDGQVVDIVTAATQSTRSLVKVRWGNGFTNVYRLGFKGKVDLRYLEESPGGECYPHHLPVLDPQNYTADTIQVGEEGEDGSIQEGDKVVVTVGVEELQQLQKSRSGWAVGMTQCIGKVGHVKGFAANGDAVVFFGSKKFRMAPLALKKVANISVGDHVRVVTDRDRLETMQEGHGGYNSDMEASLGKVGEVVKVDSDGDVVVQFGQQKWLFNPVCLSLAPGEPVDNVTVSASARHVLQRGDSTLGALNQILGSLFLAAVAEAQQGVGGKLLIKAVMENDVAAVRSLLEKDVDLVHAEEQGVSALHLAANQGNFTIVQMLVDNGAKINKKDSDGDTPILAGMKHEVVAEYLMRKGCDLTIPNNNGQTVAHKAALFNHHQILKEFIKKGVDLNAMDCEGDTPLHDAINQGSHTAAEVIIGCPHVKLQRANKKGFTPLHFAAIKDTPTIVELLLKRDKSIVNDQKDDGFTPLHVAAINNHTDVMKVLLEVGKAKVDMRTQKKQTALHVAAEQAYMDAVQLLLQFGADVNARDTDGDRPLHIVMCSFTQGGDELRLLMTLLGQSNKVKEEERLRIACYLLQAGADPEARNDQGKTALATCGSHLIVEGVRRFLAANPELSRPQRPKTPALVRQMSQSAMELCRKCCTKKAAILFVPCGHRAACRDCCSKHKLRCCPQCGAPAKSRYDENGKELGCVIM